MSRYYAFWRWLARTAAGAYCGFTCTGQDHVPRTGPAILAANHCSDLDPVLVGVASPRQANYLAKAELFRPLVGTYLRSVGAVPVGRGKGDVAAIRTVLALLERDQVVVLFPEGTRSRDGSVQTFQAGVGFLADRTGAPVVPVYIHGSFRVLPPESRWPKRAPITVGFAPAIRPADFAAIPELRLRYERIAQATEHAVRQLAGQTSALPPPDRGGNAGPTGADLHSS